MTLPTRVLGKTGIPLPILGFGTAHAGKRLTHREAVHFIRGGPQCGVCNILIRPLSLRDMGRLRSSWALC